MAILLPRICLNSPLRFVSRSSTFFPSSENSISPEGYDTGGDAKSCRMESEVTVFPEPDSPTSAVISPRLTLKEMFFTA